VHAVDIDECATVGGTKLCDVNEYCVDVVGSFKCASDYCCLGLR